MRSLTVALHEKYIAADEGDDIESEDCVIFVPKSRNRQKSNDGPDVVLPSRLTLDDEQINTVGDVQVLHDLCTNVKELDLSKNLIDDWDQVFLLLKHLPGVEFLNLMGNPLANSILDDGLYNFSFHVSDLVLNNTGVSWTTLAQILPSFPRLKELHVSLNGYTTIDLPPCDTPASSSQPASDTHSSSDSQPTSDTQSSINTLSTSLEKLYMNKVEINSWADISKLGHAFPSLQSLTIIQSCLTGFTDVEQYSEFSKLDNLNISDCRISSWNEIDKLRRFPSLTSLRIADVAFFEVIEKKLRRQQMVARLPNLVRLNGTPISETEREDAERAFVRLFLDAEDKPEIFSVLEHKHGRLGHLVDIDLSPREYITLEVRFGEKSEVMDIKLDQTVVELKKMLQNFTSLRSSKMIVSHELMSQGNVFHTVKMRHPNKSLISYNIKPEDRLLIEQKW